MPAPNADLTEATTHFSPRVRWPPMQWEEETVHIEPLSRSIGLAGTPGVTQLGAPRSDTESNQQQDSATISDDARRAHTGADHELTDEERAQVRELAKRDREVRAHEQAHAAAAGELARGGPVYEYQTGPDGVRYAVGGHVDISLREGRTPEETLRLARKAQAAANAPAEPSSQDRAVAAKAAAMAAEAQKDIQNGDDQEHGDRAAALGYFSRAAADVAGRRIDTMA